MDAISVSKALELLVQAVQQATHNPIAMARLKEKLPSSLLRKPKEIETAASRTNKVKGKGKGWDHHN
jgi:hypothetical protein